MYNFFSGCESENLMEFSADVAVNPFGAELARLSSEVYDNIDDAIDDITQGLLNRGIGVDADMVYGFYSGEYLPTEATLEALSEFCVDEDGYVDELALSRFVSAAEASYEIANAISDELDEGGEFYEDEDEEYFYEDDDVYDDVDDDIEAFYDEDDEYYDEDDYIDPETEALRAEVENLTTRQIVTDDLDSLVEYGKDLMAEGKLPPIAFSALLGQEDNTSTTRFAEFSSVCDSEGEDDVFDRLDKIEFCLEVFDQCGPLMNFSSLAPEALEVNDYDEDESEAVEAMLNAYRSI